MSFTLPVEKLAFWDEGKHAFTVHPGLFEVMVGASSEDIRAKAVVQVGGVTGALRSRGR